MTPLLDCFDSLFSKMQGVFAQTRTFQRAARLAYAHILGCGSRTISQWITASGRQNQDWSADYRLFSRSPWQKKSLFDPVIAEVAPYFKDQPFVTIAGDFTHLSKTGKKIPNLQCIRDPMSPPFHVNLIYGLRFIQLAAVIPNYRIDASRSTSNPTPPRSIPLLFEELPMLKKPGRKATPEEIAQYKISVKERRSSHAAAACMHQLREQFDQAGETRKNLLIALDGSFCNQVIFGAKFDRVEILCRSRKDAKLCFRSKEKNRFFSKEKFTPEEVRLDDSVPYQESYTFHGGNWRKLRYKEVRYVFWQTGAKRRPLRLIVMAPTPYRNTKLGRIYYRQEAYLLTTDLNSPAQHLIQAYFDRWQIEVNHREEKTTMGIGDPQVRNENSVPRQPAFSVAIYSLLLLAAQKAYGGERTNDYLPPAKWRKRAKRPSCLDIVQQLRREAQIAPEKIPDFTTIPEILCPIALRAAA